MWGLHYEAERAKFCSSVSPYSAVLYSTHNDMLVTSVPCRAEVNTGATHRVVRDYLAHYGYADTLAAFDSVAGLEAPEPAPARCANLASV